MTYARQRSREIRRIRPLHPDLKHLRRNQTRARRIMLELLILLAFGALIWRLLPLAMEAFADWVLERQGAMLQTLVIEDQPAAIWYVGERLPENALPDLRDERLWGERR